MNPLKSPRIFATVLVGMLAVAPAAVRAQNPRQTPTPVPVSPVAQAVKQLQDATAQQSAAQVEYKRARAKVEAGFKSKPDWVKAQHDVEKAKLDMEAARAAVQAALDKRADYVSAKAALAAAEAKLKAMQEGGTGSDDELGRTTQQVGDQRLAITKMSSAALEADPKYLEAKSRHAEAQQQQTALQSAVDQAAVADPDCIAAQAQVDQAQQQVAAAQQSLAQIRKSESDARAAAAKSRTGTGRGPR